MLRRVGTEADNSSFSFSLKLLFRIIVNISLNSLGGVAGATAAAFTTPLDVCKTLLNTQQGGVQVEGMLDAFRTVYKYGGLQGYFRGLYARVLYQMPATAICWTT